MKSKPDLVILGQHRFYLRITIDRPAPPAKLRSAAAARVGDQFRIKPSTQKRASIRLQLAVGYYQRNELSVALDEIKQALSADPDYAEAYSMRGLIYMQMNETHLADENFLHALRLSPNNGEFNNNYGWFLCQNGRAADSINYFDAAVKSAHLSVAGKGVG